MLDRLFPRRLDNQYQGRKMALWLFGVIVVMKSAQSLAIIFRGDVTARGADGIPLESFLPEASATIVAVFAQGALWRLFFCLVGVLALIRYRTGVPLMFALFALNYLAAQVLLWFVPVTRVGTPVGPVVNLVLFALMLAGLGLSLWRRGGSILRE
jgi:hypothetical protein